MSKCRCILREIFAIFGAVEAGRAEIEGAECVFVVLVDRVAR